MNPHAKTLVVSRAPRTQSTAQSHHSASATVLVHLLYARCGFLVIDLVRTLPFCVASPSFLSGFEEGCERWKRPCCCTFSSRTRIANSVGYDASHTSPSRYPRSSNNTGRQSTCLHFTRFWPSPSTSRRLKVVHRSARTRTATRHLARLEPRQSGACPGSTPPSCLGAVASSRREPSSGSRI